MKKKVLKINVSVSSKDAASKKQDVIEVEVYENATDEQIKDWKYNATVDWVLENVDWEWSDAE
jgi:hypothetical protein